MCSTALEVWWEWIFCVFFFKQKTAYEMRISDWSSDVCSSDLEAWNGIGVAGRAEALRRFGELIMERADELLEVEVRDTGNTITPMRGDVKHGVGGINY